MRRWGVVITAVYTAILLIFILPFAIAIIESHSHFWAGLLSDVRDVYGLWETWAFAGVLIGGQAALLLLSVDTTVKRLKPRTHILVTLMVSGVLLLLLASAAIASAIVAIRGEDFNRFFANAAWTIGIVVMVWVLWGVVFHFHTRSRVGGTPTALQRATDWLFRASVLELLIAVPSHVFVRRRNECCAPIATGFGIAAGIAVMLLSFGPSVLLLYKKRVEDRASRHRQVPQTAGRV